VKVVTLRGTYDISLERMKVVRPDGREVRLEKVPSPVSGERMNLETEEGLESTEQVVEVER
jgi:hypothetical protein